MLPHFEMSVARVRTPRVTRQIWTALDALGEAVDRDLVAQMCGSPWAASRRSCRRLSIARMTVAAPAARARAPRADQSCANVSAPQELPHYGPAGWAKRPRWAFTLYWRHDGKPPGTTCSDRARAKPANSPQTMRGDCRGIATRRHRGGARGGHEDPGYSLDEASCRARRCRRSKLFDPRPALAGAHRRGPGRRLPSSAAAARAIIGSAQTGKARAPVLLPGAIAGRGCRSPAGAQPPTTRSGAHRPDGGCRTAPDPTQRRKRRPPRRHCPHRACGRAARRQGRTMPPVAAIEDYLAIVTAVGQRRARRNAGPHRRLRAGSIRA